MKTRFRWIARGARGGGFYCVDSKTGQRFSLKTADRKIAETLVHVRNEAVRQPQLNLRIARQPGTKSKSSPGRSGRP